MPDAQPTRVAHDRTELDWLRAQREERRSMDMLALVLIYAVIIALAAVYADYVSGAGITADLVAWVLRALYPHG